MLAVRFIQCVVFGKLFHFPKPRYLLLQYEDNKLSVAMRTKQEGAEKVLNLIYCYHLESTPSHLISETTQGWTWLLLRWEKALNLFSMHSSC